MRLLRDRQEPQLRFVLRVATALRDKPKPPKGGCAARLGVRVNKKALKPCVCLLECECIALRDHPQASYGA